MKIMDPLHTQSQCFEQLRKQERIETLKKPYQERVDAWENPAIRKLNDKERAVVCKISRATYYRAKRMLKDIDRGITPTSKRPKSVKKAIWGKLERDLVLKIRRANPTYGRLKIAVILKRDHSVNLSPSTVGRIIKRLMKSGHVVKSISAARTKRCRKFEGHAEAWAFKKYEQMELGERVQIDHMTVSKNGAIFKHFQAWERISKWISADVYSNANSSCAKRFLLDYVKNAPFRIQSIQVDGGSEFMLHFEEACKELGIPLIVLPPRRPQYNGGVERGNRILREEFYNREDLLADNISTMRVELAKALRKYNEYRPHNVLKGLTPLEYLKGALSRAA